MTALVSLTRHIDQSLRDYPAEIVRLACTRCGRFGQYRKQTLIERYGADIRLPGLREGISQCNRQGKSDAACMVHYVGLDAYAAARRLTVRGSASLDIR